jgi:hypothetical protein
MEDVASGAHAAIVKRDQGALQPLLHPYLHWMQADGQVVRGRTKVIGTLQAIGISGPPASVAGHQTLRVLDGSYVLDRPADITEVIPGES